MLKAQLTETPGSADWPGAFASAYLTELQRVLRELPAEDLSTFLRALEDAYLRDCQVFIIGNGGSAATASHMACDLGKNTCRPNGVRTRRPFRVTSLVDNVPLLSALANDCGYEHVFSEQLAGLIRAGDLLIAISASGNSPNVLEAIRFAKAKGAFSTALLGFEGGQAAGLVDAAIVVRSTDYGVIEDAHLAVNHLAAEWLKHVIARQASPLGSVEGQAQ
jgi:D-sedoheptulose 7-phosphate isomerase